jgi:ribosomal protein S19E (S16A)
MFAKTGMHRERAPQRKDWWFVRCASILYRVYKDGPVGTESLRSYYGGKRNRGVKPHHFSKSGGKVIRTCLQALEKDGLIKKAKPKGREISSKGEKFLLLKSKEAFAVWQDKLKRADEIKAEKQKRREKAIAAKAVETDFKKFERRGTEQKKEKKEQPAK